jgi:hypothetical protein
MIAPRTFLIVLALAGSIWSVPAAAQVPRSRTDSLLLTIAGDLLRGQRDADGSWLSPWFTGEFMLLRPEGGALAVFRGSPPPSLGVPQSTHALSDTRYAHFFASGTPGVPTQFNMPSFDGRQIVAFPLLDSVYSIADPVMATVISLYHESFHLYQIRSGWFRTVPENGTAQIPRELTTTREFQDLAAQERDLLARALYQTRPDSIRALLRSYLAARDARVALLPEGLRASEAYDERMEASAHLVSYRAGLLAVEGAANDLVPLLASDLRNTPAFDDPAQSRSPLRHWHIYATGSAIALLLDRLRVPWQRELERGATFVDLLRGAVAR